MTTEQKAKAYDEALERARTIVENQNASSVWKDWLCNTFPELKSEDEKSKEEIKQLIQCMHDADPRKERWLAWLEKQGEQKPIDKIQLGKKYKCIASPRYSTFRRGNIYKPVDNFLCNLMNLCYECFEPIEDSEQKLVDKVKPKFKVGDLIRLKDGDGLEWTIKEMHHDGYYTIVCEDRDDFIYLDDRWELVGKLVDKNEPKFKVKYAGREYNVLEIKEIAGVTYYGIEDEPNHIDYILPDNCEIVRVHGYGVKENGSPYPTKSAIFSEQKPAWSEEDEVKINRIVACLENLNVADNDILLKDVNWLKSLKPQKQWKPSDAQMQALKEAYDKHWEPDGLDPLYTLYEQLKKLKGE